MKVEGETYTLDIADDGDAIALRGSLRLNGLEEYAPILDALRNTAAGGGAVTLDLRGLEFLNSSGIAMLSKFVIEARGREGLALSILGSELVPWQGKSLKNLQRLWPALTLTIA
ncbi:MAG: hypothetical protein PHQ14_04925 [Chromatiales bacterium]|nr:hypothetical protein [Chromatiales bacterium]